MEARKRSGGKNNTFSTFVTLFEPNIKIYFFLLVLFAAAAYFLHDYALYVAGVEASIVLILFVGWIITRRKRNKNILSYIESMTSNIGTAAQGSLANFPLPMCVFRLSDEKLISANSRFLKMTGEREHFFEVKVTDAVPGFSTRWLTDGKTEYPGTVSINDRTYRVYGNFVRTDSGGKTSYLATTYWMDVTELEATKLEYRQSRPVLSIIMLDNYDELLRGLSDKDKSSLLANVDEKIAAWASGIGGYLCKYDRDRYLYIFEERYLDDMKKEKFSLIDSLHPITGYRGIPATASIGIGEGARTFIEGYQYASLAIDMALARGGDQTVIKNRFNFEFFGGSNNTSEQNTNVKSRVMANSLGELIRDSDMVFIMGHKQSDLDCIGAEAGLVAACRKLETPAFIILDKDSCVCREMVENLEQLPEYTGVFISSDDAITALTSASLLLVVDTNRPDMTESRSLLLSCNRVGVIDHHRRAADYIEGALFSFQDTNASSASELVTELLQYMTEQGNLKKQEAEALLAGIVLDTKSFTVSVGSGTFDAAAYLRKTGVQTTDIKKYLEGDPSAAIEKSRFIAAAKIYKGCIAVSMQKETAGRVAASQAADELCSLSGIEAAYVLYTEDGENTALSARSKGKLNVQIVAEKLGGGGRSTMAGAQIQGADMDETLDKLLAAIDECMDVPAAKEKANEE